MVAAASGLTGVTGAGGFTRAYLTCAATSDCTYQWKTEAGTCPSNCGEAAQSDVPDIVTCMKSGAGFETSVAVVDGFCTDTKPTTTRGCAKTPDCVYTWTEPKAGDTCPICGTGTSTISCTEISSGTALATADGNCPLEKKPTCATTSCTYSWQLCDALSKGNSCVDYDCDSLSCGSTPSLNQGPIAVCMESSGNVVEDSQCDNADPGPPGAP